jgi:hypothetical protein
LHQNKFIISTLQFPTKTITGDNLTRESKQINKETLDDGQIKHFNTRQAISFETDVDL